MRILFNSVAGSLAYTSVMGLAIVNGVNLVSPTLFLLAVVVYIAGKLFCGD